MAFLGVDGPDGHAAVSEHLWGALFPHQSGPDGLGLYIQPYRHAQIWVTGSRFFFSFCAFLRLFIVA